MLEDTQITKLSSLFTSGKVDYVRQAVQLWDVLGDDIEDFCKLLNAIAEDEVVSTDRLDGVTQSTMARVFEHIGMSVELRETLTVWGLSTLAKLSPKGMYRLTTLHLTHINFKLLELNLSPLSSVRKVEYKDANLGTVPDTLLQLTQLSHLDISRNSITILPEWMTLFSGLTELNLSKNALTSLPNGLMKLTQLRQLNLSQNALYRLEDLSALSNLEVLNLEENQLSQLPKGLPSTLMEVHIGWNKFTIIPSICLRPDMTSCDSLRNPLIELPDELTQCETLETLNLSQTQITELPHDIGRWTQLRSLTLQQTPLTKLPESIGHCTALEELLINYSRSFQALPESIGDLKNLHTLELCMNKVSAVPESFKRLTKLKRLYLYQAKLTEVPEALQHFDLLEELNLTYNKITHLPEWFYTLPSLTKLRLKGNHLDESTIERLLNTFPDCDAKMMIAWTPRIFPR